MFGLNHPKTQGLVNIEEDSVMPLGEMKKTYHSTSYKRNNFKSLRKQNHQASINLTSQANRRKMFDKDSMKLSEYSFSKPVTGVETYYKEIQRKPAKFDV